MAAISTADANAVPLSTPPKLLAVEGQGGGSANNDNPISPLVDLLKRFPDLFKQKVPAHMDPIDRTFLAQAGRACRAAVAASNLPRAGTRREVAGRTVWMVTHRLRDFVVTVDRLAWAKASGCPWVARTCMLAAKDGHLEVLQWAREHACP